MKWTDKYKSNRPLLNSVLTGMFYFSFCWSLDFGDGTIGLFRVLMLFLPGLTFPLTTSYFKTKNSSLSNIQKISHLALSVLIYHGSVWLFSGEGRIKYITVLAGLLGSLTYLFVTKYILKNTISLNRIMLIAGLSGLAFLQYEWSGRQGLNMGISIFIWTLINGLILNIEFRKATIK